MNAPVPPPLAPRSLRLHASDNVVIAVDALPEGQIIEGVRVKVRIPRGHKLAMKGIAPGEAVLKFGQIIGFASAPIEPGDWIHEHNCAFAAFARDYRHAEDGREPDILPLEAQATFQGYRRANGTVGTRNYVGILTSVNCSASVAKFIAEEINRSGLLRDFPNIEGVIPLVHSTGCGIADKGEAIDVLKRTTFGYAAAIREMLPAANRVQRETAHASALMLALQCGGSDGYSGITANVALGAAVDILVKHGGTAILSETPEIYGAEHLLTRRARNLAVGEKLVEIIHWWEDYTSRNRMSMNNNPSPGNKAGGLTTILEKSLGAAAKGGTTTLNAVYRYAEPVTEKGFVYMDTPGYDPVAATGQVAGGANLLAFTTGRGSAYGCKPTPSMKLATNSEIFHRMIDDMDINCGDILDGASIAGKGQEIFDRLLAIASGERTKSELLGYGDAEFVPWQIGATM